MIGTKLEQYEITAHLGSGGMGSVYQAVDSRLGRNVAIKILPDIFARDPERVARFEREARVLASLSHPHIAALYGLEQTGTTNFLVMELVPGETLQQWIARTRTQPDTHTLEALSIARQIANALEAAHQTGIIHRDLKPGNIKVTPDGAVKVLDFGLAKVATPEGSAVDLSQSPTITNPSALTQAGVILGTAAYMSPEQAKGRAVDKRSDIWSFGCILYEMLTGSRLFEASDVSDTLAAVLMRDPNWSRLPADLPRPVLQLLRQCLQRDRANRMTDIAGAVFALDQALNAEAFVGNEPKPRRRFLALGWIAAALFAIVAATAVLNRAPNASPMLHFQVVTPDSNNPYTFTLSPDGQSMVFDAVVNGKQQLWLRRFDSGVERALEGTEGASYPFWSPNGISIAFFADSWLKRIDLDTELVRKIVIVPGDPRPGSWSATGTILFSTSNSPLFKVSAEGGSPAEPITTLAAGQSGHRFSQFLPDGHRFLFLSLGEAAVKGIYLGSLDSKETTRIMDGEPAFSFLPPDLLLLAQQGGLWAQRLGMASGRKEGNLMPVAPQLWVDAQVNGLTALSTSASGAIAYRAIPETRQLIWVDREGRQTGTLGDPDSSQLLMTSLPVKAGLLPLRRTVGGNTDVWLIDVMRGRLRQATVNSAIDGGAILSTDGRRILYSSDPKGGLWDIHMKDVESDNETELITNPENDYVLDWSPDESVALISSERKDMDGDIWALPLTGDRKPFAVVKGPAYERTAKFSPGGHWIAFESDEGGRNEVYAQPFPGPGTRIPISVGGAVSLSAKWPRGGHEIFYVAPDLRMMAVPVNESGSTLVVGTPRVLFTLIAGDRSMPSYDGQKFLVNRVVAAPPPISIILNWKPPK
jgi:serine/threonine protein kinase